MAKKMLFLYQIYYMKFDYNTENNENCKRVPLIPHLFQIDLFQMWLPDFAKFFTPSGRSIFRKEWNNFFKKLS